MAMHQTILCLQNIEANIYVQFNYLQEVKGAFNIIERAAQKDMQKKLADIKQAQDDLKQEQQDLKEHTLNRLDALDEKIEWFLSKGQQGAHPLSDRMSQIESLQNTTLLLIKNLMNVRNQSFSIILLVGNKNN